MELQGAWLRCGVAVDGAAPVERCRVLWLQTASWYVDVRVPLPFRPEGSLRSAGPTTPEAVDAAFSRAWAFAGTASWDPPRLTWEHLVDTDDAPGADSGVISWDGGDLIEEGTATIEGTLVAYRERWRRIAQPAGSQARVSDAGIEVSIGPWRATIRDRRPTGTCVAEVSRRDDRGAWQGEGTVLATTGLAATGLAATGLAATGLAATGLAPSPPPPPP